MRFLGVERDPPGRFDVRLPWQINNAIERIATKPTQAQEDAVNAGIVRWLLQGTKFQLKRKYAVDAYGELERSANAAQLDPSAQKVKRIEITMQLDSETRLRSLTSGQADGMLLFSDQVDADLYVVTSSAQAPGYSPSVLAAVEGVVPTGAVVLTPDRAGRAPRRTRSPASTSTRSGPVARATRTCSPRARTSAAAAASSSESPGPVERLSWRPRPASRPPARASPMSRGRKCERREGEHGGARLGFQLLAQLDLVRPGPLQRPGPVPRGGERRHEMHHDPGAQRLVIGQPVPPRRARTAPAA